MKEFITTKTILQEILKGLPSENAAIVKDAYLSLLVDACKCSFRADTKNRIEQELVNYGPWARSGLLPVFVWLATKNGFYILKLFYFVIYTFPSVIDHL